MIGAHLQEGHFTRQWLFCWLSWGGEIFSKKIGYQSGRSDLNRRPLDPQDRGVGVFAAQRRSACRTRRAVTCGLFGRTYTVWSPSGPQWSMRRVGR